MSRGPRAASALLVTSVLLAACAGGVVAPDPSSVRSASASPGSPQATPASTTASAGVHLSQYDLGTVTLPAAGKATRLPMRGTIAAPVAATDAPVAVVLHLRGLPCTDRTEEMPCVQGREARYDEGMEWLATALASRGYVALVPDITDTRDFRYEAAMVPLGWQLGADTLTRLRATPADFDVPSTTTLSGTTVAIGHSVGGDSAIWWAADRPADIAAAVLLEPAPSQVGLVPSAADPQAFTHDIPQTSRIPAGLPYAVVVGRCDDDAGYMGGQYTVDGAVEPDRTATSVLAVLGTGDHVMLNTRALRQTDPQQPGCPEPGNAAYDDLAARTRGSLGAWTADVLDVLLGRASASGRAAQLSGIALDGPASIAGVADSSVVVTPPADRRVTLLAPLGGALGVGAGGPVDDPTSGAAEGVAQRITDLATLVCPAGGIALALATGRKACASDGLERPGDGPALYAAATGPSGTWTATLPRPVKGTVIATITPDPTRPPTSVTVSAGGASARVDDAVLALPSNGTHVGNRSFPVQVRLPSGAPVSEVTVTLEGGAAYLQDVAVVTGS
jgi:hypothetical protein